MDKNDAFPVEPTPVANKTGKSLLNEALTKPQGSETPDNPQPGLGQMPANPTLDNPPVDNTLDNAQVIPKAALPQQNTAPTPGPGEVWRKTDGKCILVTDRIRGGVAACLEAETFRPTAVHPTELAHKLGTLNNNFELF